MREREAFRDQLQSLREQFAGQEVLTLDQSSKLLGLDRAARRQGFPGQEGRQEVHHSHRAACAVDGYLVI